LCDVDEGGRLTAIEESGGAGGVLTEEDSRRSSANSAESSVDCESAARCRKLATILEELVDGIALFDRNGHALYSNQAALRMMEPPFGWISGDEGWELSAATPPSDPFTLAFRRVAEAGVPERVESYSPARDRWFESYLEPKSDGTILVTIRDTSEHKRAQAEHRRLFLEAESARAEAEAANRAKDEFLATLSHELKTPVGIMNVWGEVLRRAPDEGMRQRAFQAIEEAVRAQTRLVDDLLDASRISAGKVTLMMQPTDLHPIVETTIEAARPAAAARSVRLRYVCRRGGTVVMGDGDRLLQVVGNVVTNAVKFTPDGGEVEVTLECCDPETVRITVRDNGEGIAPELLPHVFQPFRQGDASTTRSHGGLGLGLAIVLQLLNMQGGRVSVESAGLGQGTTVTMTFPRIRRGAKTTPAAPTGVKRTRTPRMPVGLRILVVDDERDVREGLAVLLEQAGAKVTITDSAGGALGEIRREPPDVLVSDIGMPEMDGYALIRSIRQLDGEHGGRVAAIALTAYESEHAAARARAAGFQLHLSKSVAFGALVEAITKLSASALPS
jgi:signal transduction histidine kinase/CheY-like chemotaxis protein